MLKVSRQGLTPCPGCQSFIKVSAPLSATVCPFCSYALADAQAPKRKTLTKGRSLLAAALLGSTVVLSACPVATLPYGVPPTEDTPTEKPATETPPAEKATTSDGGTPDLPTAPAYGIAPD